FNSFYPIPSWIPTPANLRMRKAVRRLDRIIYRFIDHRRRGGTERGDLLSTLLHARDEEGGGRMTDRQVRDEALPLFPGGPGPRAPPPPRGGAPPAPPPGRGEPAAPGGPPPPGRPLPPFRPPAPPAVPEVGRAGVAAPLPARLHHRPGGVCCVRG